MNLFRSGLLAAFIALFMVGSVVEKALGCCESGALEHSQSTEPSHSGDHPCDCVCHQAFVVQQATLAFRGVALKVLSVVADTADFPPDAVPVGIDHPPQLA